MVNKTLYIVGNGFDLHHNLETHYTEFCKYISNYDVEFELENFFLEYFNFKTDKNSLWTDFELDLGTFDWESFFHNNDNISPLGDKASLGDYGYVEDDINEQLENKTKEICSAFYHWICEAEQNFYSHQLEYKLLNIDRNSLYLSFNYTDTLNKIYQVSDVNVLQIHGSIKKSSYTLVFGHNKDVELEINDRDSFVGGLTYARDSAKLLYSTLKKDTKKHIENNIDFFDSLSNISEIIVLGHSINEIDLPYYEKIYSVVDKSTVWKVSCKDDKVEKKEKLKKSLLKIGVKETNISFFEMKNLI